MRVPFADRIGWDRRTARLPGIDWPLVVERVLLGALILSVVRLAWVIVTPVGSFGPWEGRQAQLLSPTARQALFASFDPFFRGDAPAGQVSAVVTSLALTVHGIRLNEGTGLGSAIIATPDGVQNSYAVGDEVLPGVVLKAVAFDHVTIDRGGAEEQMFLDQSTPAPEAAPTATSGPGWQSAAPPPPGAPSAAGPTVDTLRREIGFTPRMQGGRVTGLLVQSKGPAFASAGFRPGDVVTQINGRPVSDAAGLSGMIAPGARLSLAVERGAAIATVNLIVQGQ